MPEIALKEQYDLIIIGAGPAGSSAATIGARLGLDVLMLERGPYPGSKNIGGAALASRPTHVIWPNFWESAPLERNLVDYRYWLLTPESVVIGGHKSVKFMEAPYNRFSILRAKFDRWTADQAAVNFYVQGGTLYLLIPGEDMALSIVTAKELI